MAERLHLDEKCKTCTSDWCAAKLLCQRLMEPHSPPGDEADARKLPMITRF
jgi:hypothetical protein